MPIQPAEVWPSLPEALRQQVMAEIQTVFQEVISELITPQHLTRLAVIYIWQSSPQQVLSNQESLRLQYALRQRALELGWPADRVEVIDTDLG
jgi:hypothetical protein